MSYKDPEKKKESDRRWYHKHKEQQCARSRKYRQEHKKEKTEYNKKYSKEHKKQIKAQRKKHYQEHKEHLKNIRKKYFQENKEKVHICNNKWSKNNHEKVGVINRRRRACKADAPGNHTTKEVEFLRNNSGGFCPGHNRESHYVGKDKLTLDHITPLSKGGSDDASNLQMMCKPCNSSKGVN